MIEDEVLRNFVNGQWIKSSTTSYQEVSNPATAEILARVPLSTPAEVDYAANVALAAFDAWRRIPAPARIQYLFKLKELMEEHFEDLARTITLENGKSAGRRPRRDAPGDRKRGGGLRHPDDDAGRFCRGYFARHRRIYDPPAGGLWRRSSRPSTFPA